MKNNPRVILGWAMYDWANSAYMTTTAAALLPAYFADGIVPAGGYELFGRVYDGQTLWGYLVGFGTFIIFLITPILGAIADFSAAKKRFLQVFAYGGALFATSFVFVGTGDVLLTMGLFFLTQVGFVSANVFYDGFLPDISTPETIDRVSAKGYAFGYIGGGLQFAIASLLVGFHDSIGLQLVTATRISLAMAGLWWLGFATFAFTRLRETGVAQQLPPEHAASSIPIAYAKVGFGRVWGTARKLIGFKQLLLFLIAYMIYNDGVQTVINMASVYAKDTLGLTTSAIMTTFLIVQFVAFGGAYFFGWVAGRIEARPAVLICLGVYSLVAIAAYFMPAGEALPFFALGAVIGFVQGGAQSLSRSLYGSMIPEEASAEFYGFYSVLSKFSAIWGPLMFALLADRTGSGRNAILSLIVFFLVGGTLLATVNIEEARASRLRWSFEGAEARTE
ncbi:MAG: MFS transporter [Gemmatimonadota bacterium]|nr:MAG: MFS transporter [Gemmatimonadota bacterium]